MPPPPATRAGTNSNRTDGQEICPVHTKGPEPSITWRSPCIWASLDLKNSLSDHTKLPFRIHYPPENNSPAANTGSKVYRLKRLRLSYHQKEEVLLLNSPRDFSCDLQHSTIKVYQSRVINAKMWGKTPSVQTCMCTDVSRPSRPSSPMSDTSHSLLIPLSRSISLMQFTTATEPGKKKTHSLQLKFASTLHHNHKSDSR